MFIISIIIIIILIYITKQLMKTPDYYSMKQTKLTITQTFINKIRKKNCQYFHGEVFRLKNRRRIQIPTALNVHITVNITNGDSKSSHIVIASKGNHESVKSTFINQLVHCQRMWFMKPTTIKLNHSNTQNEYKLLQIAMIIKMVSNMIYKVPGIQQSIECNSKHISIAIRGQPAAYNTKINITNRVAKAVAVIFKHQTTGIMENFNLQKFAANEYYDDDIVKSDNNIDGAITNDNKIQCVMNVDDEEMVNRMISKSDGNQDKVENNDAIEIINDSADMNMVDNVEEIENDAKMSHNIHDYDETQLVSEVADESLYTLNRNVAECIQLIEKNSEYICAPMA